jgi:hypothetical protein
MLCEKIFCIL